MAATQPVLDPGAVPGLGVPGQAAYANYLLSNLPRAFATDGKSNFGWHGGAGTAETAREKAIAACAKPGCEVWSEDLDVVWGGHKASPVPVPGPFVSTWNYRIELDNRCFWRGPAAAAGVYVWAHGYNPMRDPRGAQPQAHVRAFNNAGFDVVRFDREPNADSDRNRAAGWLESGLNELRRLGYRKVIVGGQSRGAWNSLQMLARPGLADAVIAVSAAAHGSGGSTNLTAQYDDLRQLVGEIPQSRARVVFVQFAADPFAGDLPGRKALIERLRPRLGGLLILDQPEGLTGHFGGATPSFAQRYGPCLLRFVQDATAPAAC